VRVGRRRRFASSKEVAAQPADPAAGPALIHQNSLADPPLVAALAQFILIRIHLDHLVLHLDKQQRKCQGGTNRKVSPTVEPADFRR
jgi:hypothetical protein